MYVYGIVPLLYISQPKQAVVQTPLSISDFISPPALPLSKLGHSVQAAQCPARVTDA